MGLICFLGGLCYSMFVTLQLTVYNWKSTKLCIIWLLALLILVNVIHCPLCIYNTQHLIQNVCFVLHSKLSKYFCNIWAICSNLIYIEIEFVTSKSCFCTISIIFLLYDNSYSFNSTLEYGRMLFFQVPLCCNKFVWVKVLYRGIVYANSHPGPSTVGGYSFYVNYKIICGWQKLEFSQTLAAS